MGDVIGPLIVLTLGLLAGFASHGTVHRFWLATAAATATAAVFWIGGVYGLLAATAPNELGLPLLAPVLLTLATALAGALIAGATVRAMRPDAGNRTTSP